MVTFPVNSVTPEDATVTVSKVCPLVVRTVVFSTWLVLTMAYPEPPAEMVQLGAGNGLPSDVVAMSVPTMVPLAAPTVMMPGCSATPVTVWPLTAAAVVALMVTGPPSPPKLIVYTPTP
jgi:hypothetical protein